VRTSVTRTCIALLALLALFCGSENRSDAELLFELAERRGLRAKEKLLWSYQVTGVSRDEVQPFTKRLRETGFTDITLPEQDEANDAGVYEVWFTEIRHHTVGTLAARLAEIRSICEGTGGRLEYQSAHRPEK
jgi:hypothetical protein